MGHDNLDDPRHDATKPVLYTCAATLVRVDLGRPSRRSLLVNQRSTSVRRADLDDLKSKQIAFLHTRLVSPAARAEWRTNLAKILDELLDQPLGQLVEANALAAAIDAALVRSVLDPTLQPVVARTVKELRALLVAERAKIGSFVPANAQQGLRELAARSFPLLAPLVREISEHEAARLVMTDVLHDALVQFSDRVNPFVADWGLPSIVKKVSPFGLGGFGKSIEGMRADFEKRLEPEIRKFLIGFSREALRNGASSIISQSDTPAFIALRQKILTFVLDQRFADVLLDERDNETVTRIAVEVIVHACTDEQLAQQRRQILKSFVMTHAQSSVRKVIVDLGGPDKLPANVVEAFADATFPVFAAAVGSPTGKRWLEGLVAEFYDGLIAADEADASS
jgi:hypothetical protein